MYKMGSNMSDSDELPEKNRIRSQRQSESGPDFFNRVTTIVQDAWKRGHDLTVQGWIYGLSDGLLRELGMCINKGQDVEASYTGALRAVLNRRGV